MGRTIPKLIQKPSESVWYIRYQCQYRRHSRLISADTSNQKVAIQRQAEFVELFERGRVDRNFSFISLRRERLSQEHQEYISQLEEEQELLIKRVLPLFEKDHRLGKIRRRGDRKETKEESTKTAMSQLRKILDNLSRIEEITPEHVSSWGEKFVAEGRRTKTTRRHYETSIKSFTAWLVREGRLPSDPLGNFRRTHVAKNDEIRTRHAFTGDELTKIFKAARNGPVRSKWSGIQRELLYKFCMETGFRAAEAGAMRKRDFADDLTFVHIAPWFTKGDKEADQPIPEFFRPDLSMYLALLKPDQFLWPGGWEQSENGTWHQTGWVKQTRAGRVLKADAADAGIAIGQNAKEHNGGRVLDFHSLRHNFCISLRGIPKEMQLRLMRTESEQIWRRYAHLDDMQDLQEKIEAVNSRQRIV